MNFASDNVTEASQEILDAIIAANSGSMMPYGNDSITKKVTKMVQEIFERDVAVYLVSTGTAANAISISCLTQNYGSIFCHWDSHVYDDECGAPEFFCGGAKLIPIKGDLGKIDLNALEHHARRGRGDVHMTQPSAVSITQMTEMGTVYSISEVTSIGDYCQSNKLKLHMDGARFANAIATLQCTPAELTWKAGVDVLSLGATKNGALAAEAVIFFDTTLKNHFEFRRKRGGHLFSKMRLLACQMEAYLANDLWLKNAKHANSMARKLKLGLDNINDISFSTPVEGNILFPKMKSNTKLRLYKQGFQFYDDRWDKGVVRLVTAFNTQPRDVEKFIECAQGNEK